MEYMIYVLFFLTALLAIEGTAALLRRRRADPSRVRERLRALASRVSTTETAADGSILRSHGALRLASLGRLELLLYRAGGSLKLSRFLALSALLAAAGFTGLFALTEDPWRSVPALLPGLLPWLWVRRKAKKRMRKFEEQLPDALELLTRSMRAGHALATGFQLVGEELADPIGTELGLVAEEMRLGLDIRAALENLMHRVENPDLPYFGTAVLIQRQTGGNLAELLDKLGALLRERAQFSGRVRALTAQGRGAATFLALWLPCIIVIVWLVAPDYLTPLIENTWGHAVLAGAIGLDLLAYLMALRIADVQA
jgi:tight adherence protein B